MKMKRLTVICSGGFGDQKKANFKHDIREMFGKDVVIHFVHTDKAKEHIIDRMVSTEPDHIHMQDVSHTMANVYREGFLNACPDVAGTIKFSVVLKAGSLAEELNNDIANISALDEIKGMYSNEVVRA